MSGSSKSQGTVLPTLQMAKVMVIHDGSVQLVEWVMSISTLDTSQEPSSIEEIIAQDAITSWAVQYIVEGDSLSIVYSIRNKDLIASSNGSEFNSQVTSGFLLTSPRNVSSPTSACNECTGTQ